MYRTFYFLVSTPAHAIRLLGQVQLASTRMVRGRHRYRGNTVHGCMYMYDTDSSSQESPLALVDGDKARLTFFLIVFGSLLSRLLKPGLVPRRKYMYVGTHYLAWLSARLAFQGPKSPASSGSAGDASHRFKTATKLCTGFSVMVDADLGTDNKKNRSS